MTLNILILGTRTPSRIPEILVQVETEKSSEGGNKNEKTLCISKVITSLIFTWNTSRVKEN